MRLAKQCKLPIQRWRFNSPAARLQRRNITTPPPGQDSSKRTSALARLQARLPPSLRPYLAPLLSAPVSHVTSFLVLHELTALVPLLTLFALFHYSTADWLERWRAKVEASENFQEGVKRWGRYARRKGWIGAEEQVEAAVMGHQHETAGSAADDGVIAAMDKRAEHIEQGLESGGDHAAPRGPRLVSPGTQAGNTATILVEVATAYAITKVLLPVRIVASVWATPWFARVAVQPISGLMKKVAGR